jgi:hypothetical protein
LLGTLLAIGASLGIASNLAQLEQRLVPGLLDSPVWLAPLVYVGVVCLPLTRIFWLAYLEARCLFLRASWYSQLHSRAAAYQIEHATLQRRADEHAAETAMLGERVRMLERLVERATTLAGLLHTLPVVEAAHEAGTLILIAEITRRHRVIQGDLFMVISRDHLGLLGTFRLSRASPRGYHLVPLRIVDGLWWAAVRRAASGDGIDPEALVAIMVPVDAPT